MLPPKLHGPLLQEMLQAAGHPDKQLFEHICAGFPVAGALPGSHLFGTAVGAAPSAEQDLARELEHALDRAPDRLRRILGKRSRGPADAEVLKQSLAEVASGRMAGPYAVY